MPNQDLIGISLFSGTGIGDLGWRAAGVDHVAMCEVDPARAAIAAHNFPKARVFAHSIETVVDEIFDHTRAQVGNAEVFVALCTPPCQGMSKSGQGTLLANIRAGKRPKLDPRNRLVLDGLDVLKSLRPRWIVFENVIEMRDTIIEDRSGRLIKIVDLIGEELGSEYVGAYYEVEFADYGIPQRRQRLISVLTRDRVARDRFLSGQSLLPPPSHSRNGGLDRDRWLTVEEALEGFPPLDAARKETASSSLPYHRVPLLDEKKYWWIEHTPRGASAFDNQCVNPECGFQGNPTHGTRRGGDGINRSIKTTPLYCEECGSLLPRPTSEDEDGTLRIMSGYTSAYKRMEGDLPASALTRNLSYACSDNKVHPSENRVLSLAEAFVLQTLSDFPYEWKQREVKTPSGLFQPPRRGVHDGLIRLALGESVPPRFFRLLCEHVLRLQSQSAEQGIVTVPGGTSFSPEPPDDGVLTPDARLLDAPPTVREDASNEHEQLTIAA